MTMRLALVVLSASLTFGSLSTHAAPQGGSNSSPQTVRVGGDIKPPVKTKNVPPIYPSFAVSAHIQGVVILEATIGTDGKVKDIKVLRSIKELDDAAIKAVRAWEYKPTLVNNQAVQVITTIPVNFSLD
jgi:TonB family protein